MWAGTAHKRLNKTRRPKPNHAHSITFFLKTAPGKHIFDTYTDKCQESSKQHIHSSFRWAEDYGKLLFSSVLFCSPTLSNVLNENVFLL